MDERPAESGASGAGAPRVRFRTVDADLVGLRCQGCGQSVDFGATVGQCLLCGSVHHARCWEEAGQCRSYECSSGRMQTPAGGVARIGADELQRAAPLPPSRPIAVYPRGVHIGSPPPTAPDRRAWSKAALICGIASVFVFGLVTGFAAVALGIVGLLREGRTSRSRAYAASGIALGTIGVAAWIVLISYVAARFMPQGGMVPTDLDLASGIDETALEAMSPAIAGALRANVVITIEDLLHGSLGSGVVLAMRDGATLIVTNRHVVDSDYSERTTSSDPPEGDVMIRFIDGVEAVGRTVWVAPAGIDLAVVRTAGKSLAARPARIRASGPAPIGDPIFAVGNPHGLGWTFTEGTLSQHRTWTVNGVGVPIVQTSAAVNPGNSGGGLYTRDGELIGINSMTADHRVAEGLGFAIGLEVLRRNAPEWLRDEIGSNAEEPKP